MSSDSDTPVSLEFCFPVNASARHQDHHGRFRDPRRLDIVKVGVYASSDQSKKDVERGRADVLRRANIRKLLQDDEEDLMELDGPKNVLPSYNIEVKNSPMAGRMVRKAWSVRMEKRRPAAARSCLTRSRA